MVGKPFAFTQETLFELATRVLMDDICPSGGDAAYMFGNTAENDHPLVGEMRDLAASVPFLAVCGFSGETAANGFAVSGFDEWRNMILEVLSCGAERIVRVELASEIPLPDGGGTRAIKPCTDAEAYGFVRLATAMGWRDVYLVTTPIHQIRAFASTVSAALRLGSNLRVWNAPCRLAGWQEAIFQSQKMPSDLRRNFFPAEIEKLNRYHNNGDLVSADEVLDYMNKR